MANLQLCIQEIKTWLRENFLLLNEQKTEVVKFGTELTGNHLQIGEASICSSSSATSLGCTLDSSLNMSLHASRVCKSANYCLHCISKIRNFLTMDACKMLVHSGASPGFGRGGARIFFFRFGNLYVAKRHAAYGEAMRLARGVRGYAPPEKIF